MIRFGDIRTVAAANPKLVDGLLIDTSILFAASYPLDQFNDSAEALFRDLAFLQIPVFTNVTIRSEFIEQHRRVMVPEGLGDLAVSNVPAAEALRRELKTVQTQLSNARLTGKPVKFTAQKIGEWRDRLSLLNDNGKDGWELFCRDYLLGKIEPIWEDTCSALKVTFVSTRAGESKGWLSTDVSWDRMVNYVGRFGMGSSDAMILNLFMSSTFSGLITADEDLVYALTKLNPENRFAIVPDDLNV